MKKWIDELVNGLGALLPIGVLVVRLILAVIFIQSGLGKLMSFSDSVGFFQSIGVPYPALNVWISSLTEVVAGALIGIGLGTRIAAIPLIIVMMVAIATAQHEALANLSDLIRLQEFDYILMLALLVGFGSGRLGVDFWISRWFKRP